MLAWWPALCWRRGSQSMQTASRPVREAGGSLVCSSPPGTARLPSQRMSTTLCTHTIMSLLGFPVVYKQSMLSMVCRAKVNSAFLCCILLKGFRADSIVAAPAAPVIVSLCGTPVQLVTSVALGLCPVPRECMMCLGLTLVSGHTARVFMLARECIVQVSPLV